MRRNRDDRYVVVADIAMPGRPLELII